MNLIKLLDIANPKKIKDTLNLLITTYDGFDDEIRNIAKAAQKDASDALDNSEEALSTVNTANANASAAKQTSEEALTMIEAADQRSEEATQTAETALDNANTATQTAELAMNLATQAKSTVDQAISTGVFGTFVHNSAGISLLHAYLTNDINQEDTETNTYVATPTLVKNALANLGLKYSKFISDDDSKVDYWQLATGSNGIGVIAYDGSNPDSPKETGITVNLDAINLIAYNLAFSQMSFTKSGITLIYSSENGEATQFTLDEDGVTLAGKLNLPNSIFQEDGSSKVDEWTNSTGVQMHTKSTTHENTILAGTGGVGVVSADLSGTSTAPIVTTIGIIGDTTTLQSRNGNSIRTIKCTPTSTTINNKDVAMKDDIPTLLSQLINDSAFITSEDIPSVEQSTGTSTTATMSQDAITTALNGKLSTSGGTLSGHLKLLNARYIKDSQNRDILGTSTSGGDYYLGNTQCPLQLLAYARPGIGLPGQVAEEMAFLSDFNSYLPLAGGTLTGDLKLTIGKNIVDSNNKALITTNASGVIFGDPASLTSIKGSQVRPFYTSGSDNSTKSLALYSDIPDYLTTAGTTGGNTSGSLTLTAGHLYRIYVGMGDAQLSCMVKMPSTMVEQYWFWGMNLYGHYCRLHISSAGKVTYQYANIGQNNWTDNNSVYISYEDITSKS